MLSPSPGGGWRALRSGGRRSLSFLPVLPLIAGLALARPAAADDDRRIGSLNRELSTAGVERVELRLPVGSVQIEPSPDDRVHVDLEVWCSTNVFGCEEEARELELRTSRDGERLLVRVSGTGRRLHITV